jgi:hypothetical protein
MWDSHGIVPFVLFRIFGFPTFAMIARVRIDKPVDKSQVPTRVCDR